MVKKKGKDRQDKYYYLAKETGYRARSAFKLIQLNKKYNFLQSSQVLVDLCAAPGGWLQVASEHMPTSSIIVGVDLVPIRPIPRCITFQDDITKESCHSQIKQELRQFKADCFLHDGAPNIGKSWLQDAFTQSVLTLNALKLASDFLRKGGWFITKLFRSKDYQALMWIFGQLFKKVHATKPQASRSESAEMFVVCEGYKCPDKIDKKFFDPRSVFEDVESDQKKVRLADFQVKKKKKAVGYDDNKGLLFQTRKVSEYLRSETPLQILNDSNVLEFDDEEMKSDPLVNNDIIEMIRDLKSLARRDIKKLLRWHEKYQVRLQREEKKKQNKEKTSDDEEEEDSDAEIDRQLEEIKENEAKMLKKKKRDVLKERKKLRERMSHLGQSSLTNTDMSLFDLKTVKSAQELNNVAEADVDENLMDLSDEEGAAQFDEVELSSDELDSDEDMDAEKVYDKFLNKQEEDQSENDEVNDENENPLVTDLGQKSDQSLWFNKEIFKKIDEATDQVEEVKQAEKFYNIIKKSDKEKKKESAKEKQKEYYSSGSDSSDSDYELDENVIDAEEKKTFPGTNIAKRKLTADELALGTAIATSKKKKRDIIDDSFNRNTFNDEDLPDWFIEDEKKVSFQNSVVEKHVSKSVMKYYLAKDMNINVKTIKKVAEAKAKKKKRLQKKREKARKQAETVTDSEAMSGAEKAAQIKAIYKKAGLLNKKKESKTYVFAKKGTGKRVAKPPGVKGKFVVVDKRMKKDKRGQMKGNKNVKRKLKKR